MSACTCRHCRPTDDSTATAQPSTTPGPIELPTEPRPFRVYLDDRDPMDCMLHPNGQITTVTNGETWRSAFTFDEMREMNWADARIEWDPAPMAEADEPEPAVFEPVQPELAA